MIEPAKLAAILTQLTIIILWLNFMILVTWSFIGAAHRNYIRRRFEMDEELSRLYWRGRVLPKDVTKENHEH